MNPRVEVLNTDATNTNVIEDYCKQAQLSIVDESPLRKLLNNAIDTYLKNDLGLIHRNDDRAISYRTMLISIKDDELANKVFNDVKQDMGTGPLGTSKKLRERLMHALCNHLNITEKDINIHSNRNTYSMTMWNFSLALVEHQVLEATYDLIEKRLNNNIEMKQLSNMQPK